MTTMTLNIPHIESLRQHLAAIPDCRKPEGLRHPLQAVLLITICAILGGSRSYLAISQWAKRTSQAMRKRFRCRKNDITKLFDAPSEPTIRRILQAINAQTVDDVIGQWFLSLSDPNDPVAIDGKTLCGAIQENGKGIHLVSAFLHKQGTTLAQVPVAKKTNEITAVRPLLSNLELAGRLVTADAMHAQKKQ